MTPDSKIKLVSELLDLPLFDADGKYCGIVDDVELTGRAGEDLELDALLIGPGAYSGRLPGWAMWLVRKVAGDRVTRVPTDKVRTITTAVHLKCAASDLGLHKIETEAGKFLPHRGAL
jgi:sporulation protein YlmC with PRC-barrel domain